MKIALIGSGLRFDMQVELEITGKECFGGDNHSSTQAMMGFILQKNILKINREVKITYLQLLASASESPDGEEMGQAPTRNSEA